MTPDLRGRMRRALWLYAVGALALGPLTALLVLIVSQALLRARVRALSETVTTYQVILPGDLYGLSEGTQRAVSQIVERVTSGLPEVDLVGEDLAGELVALAETWDPEELAQLADFSRELDARVERELARFAAEDERELAHIRATDAARDEANEARWDAEEKARDAELLAELQAEERALDAELQAEERALDAELAEEDRLIEAEEQLARIADERAMHEERSALFHGLDEVLEEGSPVLPDEGVGMVWETDADPCEVCAELAGSEVSSRTGHHPNCECFPTVGLVESNGEAFLALDVHVLRRQLEVLRDLPDTRWKLRQVERLSRRINELGDENE